MGGYEQSDSYGPRRKQRRRRRPNETRPRELDRHLYLRNIFSRENLLRVFRKLKTNPAAPGIDGIGIERISDAEGAENCGRLAELIDAGDYKPGRIRLQQIPKANGGVRNLSLPTVLDRIVARTALEAISPFAEAGFNDRSYGFRPGRSSWTLLARIVCEINGGTRPLVGTYDIETAFDSILINPIIDAFGALLTSQHVQRVSNPERWLTLLRTILVGGTNRRRGIGQGNPLSPLALNIALNERLDQRLAEAALTAWYRWADNLYFIAAIKANIDSDYALAVRSLKPLGVRLRGDCHDLRDGSKASILGFDFSLPSSRVELLLNESVWQKLEGKLAKVHADGDPPGRLREFLAGWLDAYGPALREAESVSRRLRQVAERVTGLSCDAGELESQALRSYRKWEAMLRRKLTRHPNSVSKQ